jgi:hypothetical protein
MNENYTNRMRKKILTLEINVALLRIQTFKGLHVHWVVDIDSTSYAT